MRPDFAATVRSDFEKWWAPEYVERLIDGLRKAGLDVRTSGIRRYRGPTRHADVLRPLGTRAPPVQDVECDRDARQLDRAPSAQLGPGVLHHRDQSGAHFLRRADRLGERQTDGSWSLRGHRRHLEAVPVDARHARGGDLGRF